MLTIQPTEWLGTQVALVYQRDDMGTGESGAVTNWYSAGTRVALAFTEHAKLLGEVGYDLVKKSNGADPQYLAKFTVAPAITAGKGLHVASGAPPLLHLGDVERGCSGCHDRLGQALHRHPVLERLHFGLQAETWF